MSELTKELEQDKAFIEEVADRIYSDTDDIEESMPDPEWIDRMADIADKYITRFETTYNFANNLADKLLTSNIQLNDDQKIVLEWLVAYADEDSGDYPMQTIVYMWDCIRSDRLGVKELAALRKLTRDEQFEVLAAFAQWGLEQEEAE